MLAMPKQRNARCTAQFSCMSNTDSAATSSGQANLKMQRPMCMIHIGSSHWCAQCFRAPDWEYDFLGIDFLGISFNL